MLEDRRQTEGLKKNNKHKNLLIPKLSTGKAGSQPLSGKQHKLLRSVFGFLSILTVSPHIPPTFCLEFWDIPSLPVLPVVINLGRGGREGVI